MSKYTVTVKMSDMLIIDEKRFKAFRKASDNSIFDATVSVEDHKETVTRLIDAMRIQQHVRQVLGDELRYMYDYA